MSKNKQGEKREKELFSTEALCNYRFPGKKTLVGRCPWLLSPAPRPAPLSIFLALFWVPRIGAQLYFTVRASHHPDVNVLPVTNDPIEICALLV